MNIKDKIIHNKAIVDKGSIIKSGTIVYAFSHIMNGAVVGHNCKIGENVFIENGVTIGDNVIIKNNVAIYSGVTIENDVFLGPSCVFTNVINPRSFISRKAEFKATLIKKGASIGANATIVCGVTVNEYSMIGAGSVVTKDVSPYTMVFGNPARFKYFICTCGSKLDSNNVCISCGKKYFIKNNIIEKQE